MNYKNIKYPNTLRGFIKWTRDFPPLETGKNRRHYCKNGLYMSLELIKEDYPIWGKPYSFIGKTFRKYNESDRDFTLPDNEDMCETVFADEIAAYEIETTGNV